MFCDYAIDEFISVVLYVYIYSGAQHACVFFFLYTYI